MTIGVPLILPYCRYGDPDALVDDPDARARWEEMWQRAVDNGEFCPTCGRDADHIDRGTCGGPQGGETIVQYRCRECGDQWTGSIE